VWWFFLFWLPAFLKEEYGLKGMQVSMPIALVYLMTTVGSIFGGWLPKYFMEKGMDASKARKKAMLIYALFPLLVLSTQYAGRINMWFAVLIIGIAGSAHQAWSAIIYTNASDMFPKRAVSSVVGIGGMAGSVGGILFPLLVGYLLDFYKQAGNITVGYNLLFLICGSAYLLAWGVMHLFAPRMEKVEL
jgi:ACS family hexuronate transporter-like MFS transporter